MDTNLLKYRVARTSLRSDQYKMLEMIFNINSPLIHSFCAASLIKDRILAPFSYAPLDEIIERALSRRTSSISSHHSSIDGRYADHVMTKYVHSFEMNAIGTSTDAFKFRDWLENMFFEVLKAGDAMQGDFPSTMLMYSPIIFNTMIEYKVLKVRDSSQSEVTKEDLMYID